jgi:hypothetical protein
VTRTALALTLAGSLYVVLVIRLAPTQFVGDEGAYVQLATNLTRGYFSPPDHIQLWWGPGYPLMLAPFVALDLPTLIPRLFNVVCILAAIVLTWLTARLFVRPVVALLVAAFVAIYPPAIQALPYLASEPLALLLATGWMYGCCRALGTLEKTGDEQTWSPTGVLVASAAALAGLALTRIFFGWVILASLAASLLLLAVLRTRTYRQWVLLFGLALLLCSPYLLYTYRVTGRVLYWGTSGGLSLYWMSSPYPGELGDWFSEADMRDDPRLNPNHRAVYASIDGLDQVQADDVLRQLAVEQITAHPGKFALNWIDNAGRLILNYPYSFSSFNVRSLIVGVLNAPAVSLAAVALGLLLLHRRRLPSALAAIGLVTSIAFVGASLLSAYVRLFLPLLPWLVIFDVAVIWPARPRPVSEHDGQSNVAIPR